MKYITIILVFFISISSFGQKKAKYKYGEVDSVIQYKDATIISYKDRYRNQKRDTIWSFKVIIEIDLAHIVIAEDRYLKPIKFKK